MNLAMMYAMNVGIEALQGKRGSNLWKDAFKDTALMASFQGLDQGAKKGIDKGAAALHEGIPHIEQAAKKAATQKNKYPFLEKGIESFSITPEPREGMGGWWDKAAGVFKSEQPVVGREGAQFKWVQDAEGVARQVPITMAGTDPLKVGLGSMGLGAGLYGAGMFDPVDPPEPKYPGYNKFYAQDPGQFMPYDDPNIDPIDYSKYPEKPYSNIKEGGIIGLQGGGEPKQLSPQELFNKVMMEGYVPTAQEKEIIRVFLEQSNKAQGGIASFQQGGRASNQPNQSIIEATSEEEMKRLGRFEIPHTYRQSPQEQVIPRGSSPHYKGPRIPYAPPEVEDELGPMGPGRSLPEGVFPKTPTIDPRWFHPDNQRFLRPETQGVKAGALIHKLPSKTKVDENNPKNYKRTSGKLVVDKAGKGSENKDTMLAQLADGEFVTKSKAVRGAGLALGANPKDKKQQKDLGARYFYKQMAEFDKLAKSMAS